MSDSSNGEAVKSVVKAGAEVIIEVAKAEQETQKTYQSALELVRRAGTFLNGVFGPASQELGLLFGDQMRYWRFKNAVKILEKTQALVEERGLGPEQIRSLGFGEGLLLLEAASLEEDDTVQDMWARLMANAVDSERGTKPEKVYVDLLKSLTGREAVLLELVEQIEEKGQGFRDRAALDAFARDMNALAESKWRKFSTDDRAIYIQNLVRLRCLAVRPTPIDVSNLFAQMPRDQGGRGITPFGGTQWALIDPQKFQKVLQEIVDRQMTSSGMVDFKHYDGFILPYAGASFHRGGHKLDLPEANFMLTPLGRGLMRACKLPQQQGET
jgi:hypothetical protein